MLKELVRTAVIFPRALGARWALQQLNRFVRAVASFTHFAQYVIEWGRKPNPEWFDHFIDQHHAWTKTGNPLGWERGIFNLLAIKQGATALELCCGDGFNAHHFYAIRVGNIIINGLRPQGYCLGKAQLQG